MEELKKEEGKGELGIKKWLSDSPHCTSYAYGSAGERYKERYSGVWENVFGVSFELFNGELEPCCIDADIDDADDIANALEAITRVRAVLTFLEDKLLERKRGESK